MRELPQKLSSSTIAKPATHTDSELFRDSRTARSTVSKNDVAALTEQSVVRAQEELGGLIS